MIRFDAIVRDHQDCVARLSAIQDNIETAGRALAGVIAGGGRIFVCGNGGSAADAQHFAAELIGRFEKERRPFPAAALTTDTSILTAVANDYAFAQVFTRQLEGMAGPNDALVAISTSGNSENILDAVDSARRLGLVTVALCGGDGGRLAEGVDHAVIVPARQTARIQEGHILILHYFAAVIEERNTDKVTT